MAAEGGVFKQGPAWPNTLQVPLQPGQRAMDTIAAAPIPPDTAAVQRAAAVTAGGTANSGSAALAATAAEPRSGAPIKVPPPLSNPSVRLDPQLNIVILEFYNADGEISRKLPTERQLRAYTLGQDPELPGAPAVNRNA
jgi:hypothetical protein